MSVPDERAQAAHKTPKLTHLTVVLKYEHWRNVECRGQLDVASFVVGSYFKHRRSVHRTPPKRQFSSSTPTTAQSHPILSHSIPSSTNRFYLRRLPQDHSPAQAGGVLHSRRWRRRHHRGERGGRVSCRQQWAHDW